MLFEIGTEELPAAYLPGLIEQLSREASSLFQAQHLPVERIESFGTPRRLVLIASALAATQRKPGEEVRGPSKQASYDKAGKPTAALLGFLRSQGGTLGQTKIVKSEKGEYVHLARPPSSTPTAQVLATLLPQLVGRLRAPKTMRWDESGLRFARPIRWLLALYGETPIRCSLGRLTAAPVTWVGGPLNPRSVRVSSPGSYRIMLKRAGVILEQDARRGVIEQEVTRLAQQAGGAVVPETISHGLLEEVTHLVERPVPLAGRFDSAYLSLPREVLLASMAKHQRVFAVESGGNVVPQFAAILEGSPRKPNDVRKVIERILNARLADSLMFWKEDHARLPLLRMAESLSGVGFHEKLGSMAEKSVRLRALAEPLAEAWKLTDEECGHLRKACQLAKADLVSAMVKEFPTLQGVVGKYYAKDSNEPAAVAEAIEEHYLPAPHPGGAGPPRLPRTLIGSALAIVDKYDTLSSYFGLGIMPSGDQDPFGLRRAAQGIVEVAWAIHRALPLDQLWRTRVSMEPFRSAASKDAAGSGHRIHRYLLERLYTFAWPPRPPGPPSAAQTGAGDEPSGRGGEPAPESDCIDAVLASPCDNLIDAMDRIVSLQQLAGHPGLRKAAKVIERTRNILRGAPLRQPQVDPARLAEPPERKLWDVYASNHERVARLAAEQSYGEATTLFGELFFEPLHEFFDRVLVNVPDEPLQQNRLALMQAIHTLYTERIADLSKLTLLQREETP
ncbi:MAG: glycine--tRNA ligase subunit beta [Omnitrophica WOR_2 bacterium RIFCSPHIGHO2_02_FULL_67_20]|nr:MAG: glycine--tRNA ligase subunit beta [Omnitrophica WOR_2 bacterium RIFCSPHIGHO2_02_FULL_67_20]